MRRWAACVLLMSAAAWGQARAQERFRLSWQRGPGAESCPSADQLGRRIAARIGRDPFADEAEKSVDARVEHTSDGWRVEVRLLDRNGHVIATREPLESNAADCSALSDAVVLSVALAIEPDAALPPPKPPPAPVSAPVVAPTCPAPSCPTPTCPPCLQLQTTHGTTRARASLRALGALGVLPAPAPGVSLGAEIDPDWGVTFGAAMLYLPEVDNDDGTLAFGLSAVELSACPTLLESDSTSLQACLGFQIGSLHAVAKALRPVEPGDYLWLAPTLGPRSLLHVGGHAFFELGAGAAAPLIAHDFTVRGRPGSAYQPARIGLFGWVGLGWQSK
jgi:hypothetical protein